MNGTSNFRVIAALAAACACMPVVAHAQGYPGEEGPPSGRRAVDVSSTAEMERRFAALAELKPVLKNVKGLDKAQKDSIARIEKRYREILRGYGAAIGRAMDQRRAPDATRPNAAGGAELPDPARDAVQRLMDDAQKLLVEEAVAVRAVLNTDAQRATFDANLEANRESEKKKRQGPE